jgi:glycosyltransferase involved in cell wall biosynthesis
MLSAEEPLVSVIIPTYNSQKTLGKCLESIQNQSYKKIETIVVDSYSKDSSADIAKKQSARVIQTRWKLLGARYLGLVESNGEFILILDSDQLLERTAVERALEMIKRNFDMICLEEGTYEADTWVRRLFEADRKLVFKAANVHLDPVEGVLLARFYKRQILEKAFAEIPEELMPDVVSHDHAIIYYEAYKITQKVGILPNAVWHIEPKSVVELWKKNFRYGQSTYDITRTACYRDLLSRKVRFRKAASTDFSLGVQSYILSIMKGIPYYVGFVCAKLTTIVEG